MITSNKAIWFQRKGSNGYESEQRKVGLIQKHYQLKLSITIRNTKPESSTQIVTFVIFLCTFTWNSIVDCTPFSICSKKHCFSLSGSSNVSSVPKTTEMRTKIKEHAARRRSMLFVESVHLSGIFSALYSLNATCVYLLITPVDSKMAKITWHSS